LLAARQSGTPQSTPSNQVPAPIRSPPQAHAQINYNPPPATVPSSTPIPDASSLLERLRAAGILGAGSSTSTPTLPSNPLAGKLPAGFQPPLPLINTPPNNSRTILAEIPSDVVLKPASLKMYEISPALQRKCLY
jgi:pre-mRNA cleavage complex 2 protein Pcf11